MINLIKLLVNSPKRTIFDKNIGVELDLSFITPRIIVCGAPTTSVWQGIISIRLNDLLDYLQFYYNKNWWIWDLQAEGCNYRDLNVKNQVFHYRFDDHGPPTIKLMIEAIELIRRFLLESPDNIAVIHCKNGKGRSGTIVCSYLMAYEQYSLQAANELFTSKRMKPFSGLGVSIPSQLRYLRYLQLIIDDSSLKSKYYRTSLSFESLKITLINCQSHKQTLAAYTYGHTADNTNELAKLGIGSISKHIDDLGNQTIQYFLQYFPLIHYDVRIFIGTFASASFNLFFESIKSNSNHFSLDWRDFDGFNGTALKGRKLFDSVHISWQLPRFQSE
jgi:phosphatidylinositol-3,4,5-trisphosphate 3-phosphatase/dual-specificity protein phosphatase PTEN